MGVVAVKTIKEPPDTWEVEVDQPAQWRGRFTSADGETWWSAVLCRELGEHRDDNPGEARLLRNLRALARGHKLGRLEAVAVAARAVVHASNMGQVDRVLPALDGLRNALIEIDGPPSTCSAALARYERDPVEPEPEVALLQVGVHGAAQQPVVVSSAEQFRELFGGHEAFEVGQPAPACLGIRRTERP